MIINNNKLIKIKKSYNIIKKLKGCIICHDIIKKKLYFNFPNIIKKKNIYNNLVKYKNYKKYNFNMNKNLINLKDKYLIEIFKYFFLIKKIFKKIKINIKI